MVSYSLLSFLVIRTRISKKRKKIEIENYYAPQNFYKEEDFFYLMKYLVLSMASKKLPLLGPNKEREECIVLPAAATGGGVTATGYDKRLVPQIDPSVPQPVVQSRRRPLLDTMPT